MDEQFFVNLVMIYLCAIALLSLFFVMEVIVKLIHEWLESRLMYGNAKVGDILRPRAKKCNFTTTMRNILAKLRFN